MELRVGGKYRLGRKIGSGSFGDIYLGKYTKKAPRLQIACVGLSVQMCLLVVSAAPVAL